MSFFLKAQVQVEWTALEGLDYDENTGTLTKTEKDGWNNAGAISLNRLDANENGIVSYVVNDINSDKAIGLSTKNYLQEIKSLDYALVFYHDKLSIYESGKFRGQFGKIKVGDEFSIERTDNEIIFKKNGRFFRKRPTNPNYELFVDVSIFNQGATISGIKSSFYKPLKINYTTIDISCGDALSGAIDVTIDGGKPPYTYLWENGAKTEDLTGLNIGRYSVVVIDANNKKLKEEIYIFSKLVWTDLEGVEVVDGDLIKVKSDKFKEGAAASVNILNPFQDGMVSYTVEDLNYTRVIGLTHQNNFGKGYFDTDYAMFLSTKGSISIFERGKFIGEIYKYQAGDELAIKRVGNLILFFSNKKEFYKSDAKPEESLIVDVALLEIDATLKNVRTDFCNIIFKNYFGRHYIGEGAEYKNFNSAINDLQYKNITDNVEFLIKDGVYREDIKIDENIIYNLQQGKSISFIAENFEKQNVYVDSKTGSLSIKNKNEISFVGLNFKSESGDLILLSNASNIQLIKNTYSTPNFSNAIVGNNVNGINILHSDFFDVAKAIYLTGKNKMIHIENNHIRPRFEAVSVTGLNNLKIVGNIIDRPKESQLPLISIQYGIDTLISDTSLTDSIIVSSNIITNAGMNSLLIENFKGFIEVSGNELTNIATSDGIKLGSITGAILLNDNIFKITKGNAISIGDLHAPPSTYDNNISKKDILIGNNKIYCVGSAMTLYGEENTNYFIINNSIEKCKKGISILNSTVENNANYFINMSGNIINSEENALELLDLKGSSIVKSNTLISSGSITTLTLNNCNNLNLCANNVVNLSNGNAIDLIGELPTNFVQDWNNWFSFTGSASNNPSQVLTGNYYNVNPYFNEFNSENIIEKYRLSSRSGLLNKFTGCLDEINKYDLTGEVREEYYDIGAIESSLSNWDGLDIKLVLEDGIAMYPDNTGQFSSFVIEGLEKYSTINVKIYAAGYGLYDQLVFETNNALTFWDGKNINTNEIVSQGNYKYFLNIDGQIVSGFVYVKRN